MSWPGWQSGYFSLPPGADFAREVVRGVMDRAKGQPPEALAAVTILANSGRTLRSVRAAFDDYAAAHGALLLPRMELVGQIGADLPGAARAPLARQLELGQLVAKMIEAQPGLADGQSVPELTASLSALMAEMQTEGRAAGDLERADAGAHAAHWQRALMFLKIAAAYYLGGAPVDAPARQRLRAEQLADAWSRGQDLPRAPLLLVGSTGSHGATRLLLRAVASLPQGAVVLPGYDDSMAAEMWDQIAEASEDHPQARLAALREGGVRPWTDARGPDARNRLISLALRPAPVTDQWIAEGPSLDDLQEASEGLSLIVAEHPQQEADAIALAIREAVGARRPVTLFAADRAITRRVAAALDRWGIHLHDSAGQPLSLTDTGLFLRHVVAAFGQPLTIDVLMTIFKHRMAAAGAEDGAHLLHLRALELDLRRRGPAFPDGAALRDWGAKGDDARQAWAGWMAGLLDRIAEAARDTGPRAAAARLDDLTSLAGAIADGPDAAGGDALWRVRGGAKVQAVIALLRQHIALAHKMRPGEFAELVTSILQSDASREPARSAVRACGTREARTEANRGDGALVIIAGLNEGSWPQALSHDPWLSRQMRRDVGLTLPERQIGLAAHDFQQAAAAPEVILSRARRDNDAETIPSRWLNRLLNLMNGLPAQNGALATKQMEARGARWTALARQMAGPRRVDPPAPRPAPIPPAPSFNRISVTEVKTLIRDPYAIYAKKVLRLEKLPGLRPEADALLRGNTLHRIVERLLTPPPAPETDFETLRARFLQITQEVLEEDVPWHSARAFWQARMERIADRLVRDELKRLARGRPKIVERRGAEAVPGLDLVLTAKPDRIDLLDSGAAVHIYDYKSGALPSDNQMLHFDKQLLLEAAMVRRGTFDAIGAPGVEGVSYIELGGTGATHPRKFTAEMATEAWDGFVQLAAHYLSGEGGFTARRALEMKKHGSDYDQLSRYGEWGGGDASVPQKVGDHD